MGISKISTVEDDQLAIFIASPTIFLIFELIGGIVCDAVKCPSIFSSFGYAGMSLCDPHLSVLLVLLSTSASLDSTPKFNFWTLCSTFLEL